MEIINIYCGPWERLLRKTIEIKINIQYVVPAMHINSMLPDCAITYFEKFSNSHFLRIRVYHNHIHFQSCSLCYDAFLPSGEKLWKFTKSLEPQKQLPVLLLLR